MAGFSVIRTPAFDLLAAEYRAEHPKLDEDLAWLLGRLVLAPEQMGDHVPKLGGLALPIFKTRCKDSCHRIGASLAGSLLQSRLGNRRPEALPSSGCRTAIRAPRSVTTTGVFCTDRTQWPVRASSCLTEIVLMPGKVSPVTLRSRGIQLRSSQWGAAAASQASTCSSRISSGSAPLPRRRSWKARSSNFAPRRARTRVRSSRNLIWPIL